MEEPPLRKDRHQCQEGRFSLVAYPCRFFLSPVHVLVPAPDLASRGPVPVPAVPFLALARYVLCPCLYLGALVLASFGRDLALVHAHGLASHALCLCLWCRVHILGSALAQVAETQRSGLLAGKMLTLLLMMVLLELLLPLMSMLLILQASLKVSLLLISQPRVL